MLRPEAFSRLAAEYHHDRALAEPAAPVRDQLDKVARLGAAFADALADLPPAGRELVDLSAEEVDGAVDDLRGLSAGAHAVAFDLTKGMARGGRRSTAQALGHLSHRAKLLIAVRTALAELSSEGAGCLVRERQRQRRRG